MTCEWKFRILQGQGIGSLNFSLQKGTNDHSYQTIACSSRIASSNLLVQGAWHSQSTRLSFTFRPILDELCGWSVSHNKRVSVSKSCITERRDKLLILRYPWFSRWVEINAKSMSLHLDFSLNIFHSQINMQNG